MLDYYAVLGLSRDASTKDINKAYRGLALKNHPSRYEADDDVSAAAAELFLALAESYEVLSQEPLRAIYDKFGSSGLKDGIPSPDGSLVGGTYRFNGKAMDVYEKFFGSTSPYADLFGEMGDGAQEGGPPFYKGVTGLYMPAKPQKMPTIKREFECSLTELYTGCVLKVPHEKKVLNEDGVTTSTVKKMLQITVTKGMAPASVVTFKEEGDQGAGIIPADVTYTLKEKKMEGYTRSGDDLIYTANIMLVDALCGCSLPVTHLSGKVLAIPTSKIISTDSIEKKPQYGMPKASGGYGDLIIKFNIIFPEELSLEKRAALRTVLPESDL